MAGVLLVDAGLVLLLIGAVSLVRPLRWLGMRSRKAAALWIGAGLGTLAAGALLPARLKKFRRQDSPVSPVRARLRC